MFRSEDTCSLICPRPLFNEIPSWPLSKDKKPIRWESQWELVLIFTCWTLGGFKGETQVLQMPKGTLTLLEWNYGWKCPRYGPGISYDLMPFLACLKSELGSWDGSPDWVWTFRNMFHDVECVWFAGLNQLVNDYFTLVRFICCCLLVQLLIQHRYKYRLYLLSNSQAAAIPASDIYRYFWDLLTSLKV